MTIKNWQVWSLFFLTLLIVTFIFLPGLNGSWLVDDDANLSIFKIYSSSPPPYADIIFSNTSGPLGRPISMASFAANHILNLFSTPALKATNIGFHLANGLLIFLLLSQLFRQRNPNPILAPSLLALAITTWWLVLPMHISTVLYIVQRMTQMATFFSLLSCLAWVIGRQALQKHQHKKGWTWLLSSLFILFPLAIFSKESAFCTLAWILLIDLFFFTANWAKQISLPKILFTLFALTFFACLVTVWGFDFSDRYRFREFTLTERLLTEPRILWTYISDIFFPNNQRMGLFQDDYLISRSFFSPWTTALAIFSLATTLTASAWLSATRWWPIAFGIIFYFSGHLVESTIIPLELYFEHRNYLPSLGLLLAATCFVLTIWPWRKQWLCLIFTLYLGLLSISTWQRSSIWGDKSLLLETSAINHPHSLRAWSDYAENLLTIEGKGGHAALVAVLTAANNNPDTASIFYLQMISMHCRLHAEPGADLLHTSTASFQNTPYYLTTSLTIGLDDTLNSYRQGFCGKANFDQWALSLASLDHRLSLHYQEQYARFWSLRFNIAEWLIETHHIQQAIPILADTWQQGIKADMPLVGLALAGALIKTGQIKMGESTLQELSRITADAPPEFRTKIQQLQQQIQQEHQP